MTFHKFTHWTLKFDDQVVAVLNDLPIYLAEAMTTNVLNFMDYLTKICLNTDSKLFFSFMAKSKIRCKELCHFFETSN